MSLELNAEFHPLLARHIAQYRNPGKGHTSCLSFNIYEEIINVMRKAFTQEILKDILNRNTSPLWILFLIYNTGQLSFIIQYVNRVYEKFWAYWARTGRFRT